MNETYINDFLLYLELDLNYSNNTINTYENSLKQLDKYINKDLLKLNSNDIENFIISSNELNPSSISNYISSYKAFYNYYIKIGKINSSPKFDTCRPKIVVQVL